MDITQDMAKAPPEPSTNPHQPSSAAAAAAAAAAPHPSSSLEQTITELEHGTWRALRKRGADLLPYLSSECTMQFPLGASLSTRSEPSISDVLTADAYIPWRHYRIEEVRVTALGAAADSAVISYRVNASRGEDEMDALVGSVWRIEDGEWKLVFHQQTPF